VYHEVMATIRQRGLPAGWYPADAGAVREVCRQWHNQISDDSGACAAIVPHAGWAFSGELAYRGVRALDPDARTVVVIGGHLAPGQPILVAVEQGFETPLGVVESDTELVHKVRGELSTSADNSRENSVEIHLPLIAHLFPRARVVWLRAPADRSAIALGQLLAREAEQHKLTVVGSTDLTHYGPRFALTRPGSRESNRRWAETVNDRGFLDCSVAADPEALLEHAARNQSACSPGAAAAAVAFARTQGAERGRELGYANSFDRSGDANFVGYAAVGFWV